MNMQTPLPTSVAAGLASMNKDSRQGSEVDLRAIDEVREAHVTALNVGNANAWVAQFADDGVQMPPNAPANVGKAMITSWSQALLSQFRVQFALSVEEVRVVGEWAFERGSYTISLNSTAGGPPMRDSGKYITIYERKPTDTWRMARDIWNSSDLPFGEDRNGAANRHAQEIAM